MPSAGWFRIQEFARSKTSGVVLVLSGLAIADHGALSDFGSRWAPSAVRVDSVVASPNARSQGPAGGTSLSSSVAPTPGAGPPAASSPVIVTLAPHSRHGPVARPAAIPRDRDSL